MLEVPISPEDINISHKIKSKGVGSILVKFQSHKAKSRLYKARTKPGAGENTPIRLALFLYTHVPTIDDVTSGPKAYNFSHERENQT